jgi:ubiquinone/menaquinone biosynthesis C-methylase UbiE
MAQGTTAALTPEQARRVYNRIGRFQDWQRFYESPALTDLIEHADFSSAKAVYELGCGTGALARTLFENKLGPTATYRAVDVSDTMVRLTRERLAPWSQRCSIAQTEGALPLEGTDHSYDRFLAAYVFDLLDTDYAQRLLDEARRLLEPAGRLCVVSLTEGISPLGRAVSGAWKWAWSRSPKLVGGCRPIRLAEMLTSGWEIEHRRLISAWSLTSEVVVATPPAD